MRARPRPKTDPGAPNTSVVVCTYDERRRQDLAACLDSLEQQTRRPLETIVVVDHNPALLERAREAFPGARAIANGRSRGLAGARNSGIEAARGEIVAFIDDDARAEPQWLEELGACFADPATLGAGGALIPRWDDGVAPRWFPPELYWVLGCSYAGLPAERARIRNPIGANMAVRADVLREAGAFREGDGGDAPREIRSRGVVRAGGNLPDDTELAIRVSERHPDGLWLYEPAARVHHTVTPARATLGYLLRRSFEEGDAKAHLAHRFGARRGLSSERRHLARALPRGFARGLRDLLRGDPYGPLRSAVIGLGLATTAAGFLAGTLSTRAAPRR